MKTPRSFWPREHGAYGQLAFPSLAALACGTPSWASAATILAAVSAFLAHEPLLIVLGRRGKRALREDGARARRLLAIGVALSAGFGAAAIVLAGPLRVSLLPSAVSAGLATLFVAFDREKTLAGEVVAAAALSSLALPVGALAGVAMPVAAAVALVWTLGFSLATFSVREVIRGAREPSTDWSPLPLLPSLVVTALAVAVLRVAPAVSLTWAVAPFVLMAVGLAVAPPPPRHLRRVGWSLIGASVVTLAMIAVIGRA